MRKLKLEHIDFSKCEILLYKNEKYGKNESEKKQLSLNSDLLKLYDLNYKRFLDDVLERMAQDELTPEQREAFRYLSLRNLERRAKYFVNSSRRDSEIIFTDIDAEIENDTSDLNKVYENKNLVLKYSYGMLLERIYKWGRENQNGYFEDKPYISCILAYFTIEMTRAYLHYCYDPDKERRNNKYRRRLLGFIGKNVGSEWLGEAFPRFKAKSNMVTGIADIRGYADASPQLLVINLNLNEISKIEFLKWVEKYHYIEILEILNMLFSCVDDGEIRGLEFEFVKGKNRSSVASKADKTDETDNLSNAVPHIEARSNAPVKFDVMTFLLRSLDYKKTQEEIENNITNVLLQIRDEYWRESSCTEKEVRAHVKKSLKFKLENTDEKNGLKVAFPFYNLDMSYNICKRLRNTLRNAATEETLLGAMQTFYCGMEELLEAEKKEYENNFKLLQKEDDLYINAEKDFDYLDNYKKCPFIKYITGISRESMDKTEEDEKATAIMNEVERVVTKMAALMKMDPEAEK